jgi:uncharacterized protein with PIN domain
MRFLVDESMGNRFATLLKKAGHDVVFVGDAIPEVMDEDVLSFAARENRVLITADKDFGELVVRFWASVKGVVLFRTLTRDPLRRLELAEGILEGAAGRFIVVTEGRVRVRRLK